MSKLFLEKLFGNVTGENTENVKLIVPIAEQNANELVFIAKALNNLTLKSIDAKEAIQTQVDAMVSLLNGGTIDTAEGKKDLSEKIAALQALLLKPSALGSIDENQTYVDEAVEIEKILMSAFNGPKSVAAYLLKVLMQVALIRDPVSGRRVIDLFRADRKFDATYKAFIRG